MYARASRQMEKEVLPELPNPANFAQIVRTLLSSSLISQPIPEYYQIKARQRLGQCVPTLVRKQDQLYKQGLIPKLFSLCNKIKVHHSQFYSLAQTNLTKQKPAQFNQSAFIGLYMAQINLRHSKNEQLRQISINNLIQSQQRWSNDLNFYNKTKFLQLICLDQTVKNTYKQCLFKLVFARYSPTSLRSQGSRSQDTQTKQDVQFAKLYEMVTILNLKLEDAIMRYLLQGYQNCLKFIPKEFAKKQAVQSLISISSEKNRKKFQSIFEMVFQNNLERLGYDFDSNFYLGNNQYDIVVNGFKRVKWMPLSEVDIDNPEINSKEFPIGKVEEIAQSTDIEWLPKQRAFDEKVVVDLHGPCHFISSNDRTINGQMTRMEEFRYLKLPLYGIHRYNIVPYNQWQEQSKYPIETEKYINNLIQHPKKLHTLSRSKP